MDWLDQHKNEDKTIYKVVINKEEQYSLWPAQREVPLGWSEVGKSGTKDECEAYIKEVWTDMRPLSLRKKMEEMERERRATEEHLPQIPADPVPQTIEEIELEAELRAREQARIRKGKQ